MSRPRHLDRWRAQIEQWLRQDRRLTAKRIRRLLLPLAGPVAERTVRWYVARLKAAAAPKEVYVHRSPRHGVTLEVDFGESWAEVAGVLRKVKYVVATLPYSGFVRLTLRAAQCRDAHSTIPLPSASLSA